MKKEREPHLVELYVIQGVEGPSLYLSHQRISGPKPWGGGPVIHTFWADADEVRRLLRRPRKRPAVSARKTSVPAKVLAIAAAKGTHLQISIALNTPLSTVSAIKSGRSWSRVTGIKHKGQKKGKVTPEIRARVLASSLSAPRIAKKVGLSLNTIKRIRAQHREEERERAQGTNTPAHEGVDSH